MMRPMKLAGSELMFGAGSLEYIKSIHAQRASIVVGGSSMEKSGMLAKVQELFREAGAQVSVIRGVEPDPSLGTVLRGAGEMLEFQPDLIVGLGGGSAMDAAKAMWIYYEHPELKTIEEILPPNEFPQLRTKARLCCIPSTSGTASEVSRSIVISDNKRGIKHGIGNMEMMPDIAICDPEVTMSMPAHITAETGMDAMTHAVEALVSQRANYVSDLLAKQAVKDIFTYLPLAYEDGEDVVAREKMLNASMVAGLAFTNVSLGIVHSIAHTLGSFFHIAHGLGDAIVLPYVIHFNETKSARARNIYKNMAEEQKADSFEASILELNKKLYIADRISALLSEEQKAEYQEKIPEMADMALADGCTKTNPAIPTKAEMEELFKTIF
ncbi:MAG: iron-containing alcohol dehydrogenase [Eubacterium sp.]|nr:iron-containing alcohol dehydrogenase [Eubacterium sp.]